MRDSELAASIVDGDPGALAETYDRYADLLWSYSRSLLNDERQAAEAVADTFVIASSRLDVLPAPARLRAWLYAVTRMECLRRMRAVKDAPVPGSAERLRQTAQKLSTGEQQQLRALLAEGFTGLDDDERDAMQMVWHGLDLAEVGTILGLPRAETYTLFTRARDQLEATVGVLLMGWSGHGGCDVFEETLYGRDSKLTPELRARLSKHILRCDRCTESYQRQMRPSLMLALSVGALLSEAEDARAAAGRAPAGLWEQVYQMTSAASPESRWHKLLGGRRVTFGPDGFPRQLAVGREGMTSPVKVAAVGAVAVAATATGWATHGHFFAARPDASTSNASSGVAPVTPQTRAAATAAAGKGAHAGKPSTKTVSHHKAAHAKPQPAGSSPSALPAATSSGTSVPVSAGSSSSGSPGSSGSSSGSASSTATSGSTSTGSSPAITSSSGSSGSSSSSSGSSGSSGSGSSGSGSSGSGSGGSGSSGGSSGGLGGVVKKVTGTVSGVVGGVTSGL